MLATEEIDMVLRQRYQREEETGDMTSIEDLHYYLHDVGLRFGISGLRSTGKLLRRYSEASVGEQAEIARDYSLSLPNPDDYMGEESHV